MITAVIQGNLTQHQRGLGMWLREDDNAVWLLHGIYPLCHWDAKTVTFAQIQQAAYQKEQELRSGVEFAS